MCNLKYHLQQSGHIFTDIILMLKWIKICRCLCMDKYCLRRTFLTYSRSHIWLPTINIHSERVFFFIIRGMRIDPLTFFYPFLNRIVRYYWGLTPLESGALEYGSQVQDWSTTSFPLKRIVDNIKNR